MALSDTAFSDEALRKIFSFVSELSDRLISRENGRLEFKESFDLGSADKYAKTAAAFANAQGGYIVFGVKDSPRQMIGLKTEKFANFDVGKLTASLNEWLSPEIDWDSKVWEIRGYKVGLLYFAEAAHKPVVCKKNGGAMQEGAIYYRYRGRSEIIKYTELRRILDEEKERERSLWFRQLNKIADAGIEQVAVLDLQSGEVSGAKGNFFISDELLPKLQFLREGEFVEREGAPALKLIGNLQAAEGPVLHSTIRVPTALREPQILSAFLRRESVINPIDYLTAACGEATPFLPLYYFIQQTTESVQDIVELLRGLEVRGTVRSKIISRLETENEVLTSTKVVGTGGSAVIRAAMLEKLRNRTIEATDLALNDPNNIRVRILEAITHTDTSFSQDYLFRLLEEHYRPRLTTGSQTTLRKAICHLDLTWFKPLIDQR